MASPRLAVETARALAEASELARARRHDVVDIEHVLLVLLDLVDAPITFGGSSVSRAELARRLDAILSARPVHGAYRDGVATLPRSPRLEAALENAAKRRGLAILRSFRGVGLLELLRGLLLEREVASLAASSTLDTLAAGVFLARATRLARDRMQYVTGVEHVLLAASETAWFQEACANVGLDPRFFAERVEAILDDRGTSAGVEPSTFSQEVVTLLRVAASQASASGEDEIRPERLTGHALRGRPALLEGSGTSTLALLRSLLRKAPDPPSPPLDPKLEYDVVFHDDDYTTMEFVVSVLCDVFGLAQPDATAAMTKVHRSGEYAVARLYGDEAQARIDAALAAAEVAGMPLRISARPALALR